jgi:hypothetical protein
MATLPQDVDKIQKLLDEARHVIATCKRIIGSTTKRIRKPKIGPGITLEELYKYYTEFDLEAHINKNNLQQDRPKIKMLHDRNMAGLMASIYAHYNYNNTKTHKSPSNTKKRALNLSQIVEWNDSETDNDEVQDRSEEPPHQFRKLDTEFEKDKVQAPTTEIEDVVVILDEQIDVKPMLPSSASTMVQLLPEADAKTVKPVVIKKAQTPQEIAEFFKGQYQFMWNDDFEFIYSYITQHCISGYALSNLTVERSKCLSLPDGLKLILLDARDKYIENK